MTAEGHMGACVYNGYADDGMGVLDGEELPKRALSGSP